MEMFKEVVNALKAFLRDVKAVSAIVGVIVAAGVAAIAATLIMYVVGSIQSNLATTNLPSSAQSIINSTFEQTYNVLGMSPTLILVLFASAIIGILAGMLVFKR